MPSDSSSRFPFRELVKIYTETFQDWKVDELNKHLFRIYELYANDWFYSYTNEIENAKTLVEFKELLARIRSFSRGIHINIIMSIEKSSTLCINEKYKLQTFFETRRQKFKILRSMLFEKYCKIRKKIMKKRAAEDEKKFTNDVNNFVKEVNGNDGDDDFVDY